MADLVKPFSAELEDSDGPPNLESVRSLLAALRTDLVEIRMGQLDQNIILEQVATALSASPRRASRGDRSFSPPPLVSPGSLVLPHRNSHSHQRQDGRRTSNRARRDPPSEPCPAVPVLPPGPLPQTGAAPTIHNAWSAVPVPQTIAADKSAWEESRLPPLQTPAQAAAEEIKADKKKKKAQKNQPQKPKTLDKEHRSSSIITTHDQNEIAKTRLQLIVEHPMFDSICAVVIMLNSLSIGASVQYVAVYGEEPLFFLVFGKLCAAYYFVELSLRCGSHRGRLKAFFITSEDRHWNIFDLVLVLNSVVDVLMTVIFGHEVQSVGSGMRILRMLRIVRIFRVFRFCQELALLAATIVGSMMSLMWAIVLLFLIIYVFGISLTRGATEYILVHGLGADTFLLNERFGTLPTTFYTLWKSMLNGQDWGEVSDQLFQLHWAFPCIFFLYIAVTILAMANVITGVFVDNVYQTAQVERALTAEKEMEIKERYINDLRELFGEMDGDCSGTVTWEEFEEYLEDERVQMYFHALQIDASDTQRLFKLIDTHGSGEVDIENFLQGCIRLKGQARSIDVHIVLDECKKLSKSVASIEVFLRLNAGLGGQPTMPLTLESTISTEIVDTS
mmetsp:Transcript_1783/g.3931  ORF Transcript_1783/g.3931 Transcript_1783/m.3931 type:complete len:618 (+) Transcript_1783:55-1908(+)